MLVRRMISIYSHIFTKHFVTALERTVAQVIKEAEEIELEEKDISTPFTGINQIQIQESIEQLKLDAEVEKFNELENINENIQDLHGMYKDLNCMVVEQKESVDIIEANVEHTQEEVNHGIKHLVKACKQVIKLLLCALSPLNKF